MQALWMLLAAFLFATMGVCIKFASCISTASRSSSTAACSASRSSGGFTRARGVSLRTTVPSMHVWRSIVGTLSLTAWFYSIAILPLATAMTLNYMSSIWIAAFLLGGSLLMQGRETRRAAPGTAVCQRCWPALRAWPWCCAPPSRPNSLIGALVGLMHRA